MKVYKSTKIDVDNEEMLITFCTCRELCERQHFNFIICQRIPCCAECFPVFFEIAGTKYPLLNKYGEQAVGSELVSRKLFYGYYGELDTPHIITACAPACE